MFVANWWDRHSCPPHRGNRLPELRFPFLAFLLSCALWPGRLTFAQVPSPSSSDHSPPAQTQPAARLPVPSDAALAASRKLIREIYPSDLSRQTISERRLLASKMLDAGLETNDNPTDRYVLLDEAITLAAGAGDAVTVGKAADALDTGYQCNAAALRADALARCYAVAPSAGIAGQVAVAEIDAAERAAADDDFDAAGKYAEKGTVSARNSGDRALAAAVQSRAAAIRTQRTAFLQVKTALDKLKADPNNATNQLAVGQYFCFTKGRWDKGLAHLALGSDARLKQIAQRELAASPDPQARAELAEQWWNVADAQPPQQQKVIRAHAAELYRAALPALAGLARAVAQKRIDLAAADATPGPASLKPSVVETSPKPPLRELLAEMTGSGAHQPDGTVVLVSNDRITTHESFKPPVAFRIVAQTDSTNIRIKYAATQIIFDWEGNPAELRVDGGPANHRHKKGAGSIPPHTWAEIGLVVLPDAMIISVNGQQRYRTAADFSQIDQTFGIFTAAGATVQVKSVTVHKP
jgi:hypothetical protein